MNPPSVDSTHKWSVLCKAFPLYDVIMILLHQASGRSGTGTGNQTPGSSGTRRSSGGRRRSRSSGRRNSSRRRRIIAQQKSTKSDPDRRKSGGEMPGSTDLSFEEEHGGDGTTVTLSTTTESWQMLGDHHTSRWYDWDNGNGKRYKPKTCSLYKNTKRHTAQPIVSWPNPKQWEIVHTSDLMVW